MHRATEQGWWELPTGSTLSHLQEDLPMPPVPARCLSRQSPPLEVLLRPLMPSPRPVRTPGGPLAASKRPWTILYAPRLQRLTGC
ncbi:hypothetical protein P170DRAFT_432646 [Aspergillus steynii IBT 23096]|uniref:Uncharacterized protein n=1 Tax=Aspergillus steynii IBT 23096 TaxID=1392250 RepID=A0A2I2GQE9_9EURO|nr:uncharacterized protein P170DRAFT_432646 [Aspergillus steynii IBT 23096]PLB55105.1 hypothetical protein P170DRAFT_432646 [Aspergillus steynii IBT 23096]